MMMNLDQQVQALIQDAPDDPEMRQITRIFIPMLKRLASRRGHLQYHVVQTDAGEWLRLSLVNRTQSSQEKTAIYAFSTAEDAKRSIESGQSPPCDAVQVAVIDLLFKFFALNLGDSLVFFETPGNRTKGFTVSRSDFEDALYESKLPPDIA
jgi:hypothetical protein